MAYPERQAEGFYSDSNRGLLSLQEDWTTEIPDTDLSFDLSFGLLSWNDHSGQQNRNVDVALHAIDISGQFTAAFPPPQDQALSSTTWPSVQTAPSLYAGQSQVLEPQGCHPGNFMRTSEILHPGGGSAPPFELPDEFQGFTDLRVGTCKPDCEWY
jgi:hypothetical protein